MIYEPSNGMQDGHKAMTLRMLFGAFEILLTGWIVALIIFSFELLTFKLSRKRLAE